MEDSIAKLYSPSFRIYFMEGLVWGTELPPIIGTNTVNPDSEITKLLVLAGKHLLPYANPPAPYHLFLASSPCLGLRQDLPTISKPKDHAWQSGGPRKPILEPSLACLLIGQYPCATDL